MVPAIYRFGLDIDVLGRAVCDSLPGYAPRGWVKFTREPLTRRGVIYELRNNESGDLGTVTLRKLGQDNTEMHVQEPALPVPTRWAHQLDAERADRGYHHTGPALVEELRTAMRELTDTGSRRYARPPAPQRLA